LETRVPSRLAALFATETLEHVWRPLTACAILVARVAASHPRRDEQPTSHDDD
jgi:hypothetical protein